MKFSLYQQIMLALAVFTVSFSLALNLKISDIKKIFESRSLMLIGCIAQLIVFPIVTLGFVFLTQPPAAIALAILFVAACPGGSISNYLTFLSGGHVAYSISLTLLNSLISVATTPFMMLFLANFYPPTREIMTSIVVSKSQIILTLVILLLSPLVLGMFVNWKWPIFSKKILRSTQVLAFVGILGITVVSIKINQQLFDVKSLIIIKFIFLHNLLGLIVGYLIGRFAGFELSKKKALSIEVGFQNTTPAIAVALAFFSGHPLVSFSAGIWAVWQYISGLILAGSWRLARAR